MPFALNYFLQIYYF